MKRSLRKLRLKSTGRRDLSIVWVDDRRIAELAGRFCGESHATDVLSFPGEEERGPLGEVVVSLDTASAQAKERGIPAAHELLLLVLHGILHLSGFDDRTPAARREMRVAEFENMMRML